MVAEGQYAGVGDALRHCELGTESVHQHKDYGSGVKRQELAQNQASNNSNAQWLSELKALT
jgi:hypothetical protein